MRKVSASSWSVVTKVKVMTLGLMLLASAARAQTRVRGLTAVAGGASDNARGEGNQQRHTVGTFTRGTLGLKLTHDRPTSHHELGYLLSGTAHPGNSGANSFTHDAAGVTQLVWSRATLELAANGAYSVLNDIGSLYEVEAPETDLRPAVDLLRPDPAGYPFGPQPLGTIAFVGGSASQSLSLELSPRWGAYQSTDFQFYSPIIGTRVAPPILTAGAGFGFDRIWPRDVGRLELDGGLEVSPERLEGDELLPPDRGHFGRAALGWGHQLTPGWASDLSGGVYAAKVGEDYSYATGPAWRAALRARGEQWRGNVAYDHTAHSSVVLGGIFLSDRVSLRALRLFGQDERFRFTGRFRIERLMAMAVPPEERGPATRWQAMIGVAARPWSRRHIDVSLTYRLTEQLGARLGPRNIRTLERNVVLLTVTVGVPWTGPE